MMSLQKNALFCDGEVFFVDRGLLMGASIPNQTILQISDSQQNASVLSGEGLGEFEMCLHGVTS